MQSNDLLVRYCDGTGGDGDYDQQVDADDPVEKRKIDVLSAIK